MFLSIIIFLPILCAFPTYLISRLNERAATFFALAVLASNFLLAVYTGIFLFNVHATGFQLEEFYQWIFPAARYHVGVDGISMVLLVLDTFLCLVVGWASYYLIPHDQGKWYVTLLTLQTGVLGVILSINLVIFYFAWELVLVPMFFMIAKWGHKPKKARRAALKFFLFTFVGGISMLLGFIYLYIKVGTLSMIAIAEASANISSRVQTIAMLFIFFGLAVKLPVFPFHTWLPDAHVRGPAPSSALLAGLLLKEAAYMFMRASWFIPKGMRAFTLPFSALAIIGILYPVITAIYQNDMKRMTSYFSINHMAHVFLAATAAAATTSSALYQFAIAGSVFVIVSHGLIMSTLFLGCGFVYKIAGTRKIEKLSGLGKRRPWLAAFLIIGWVAAGGMPGLAAFVGETMVYIASVKILFSIVGWWVTFAIAGPLIVLSFFLWLAQRTFFGKKLPELKLRGIPWFEVLPFAALTVANIFVGVYPTLVNDIMKESIAALFGS